MWHKATETQERHRGSIIEWCPNLLHSTCRLHLRASTHQAIIFWRSKGHALLSILRTREGLLSVCVYKQAWWHLNTASPELTIWLSACQSGCLPVPSPSSYLYKDKKRFGFCKQEARIICLDRLGQGHSFYPISSMISCLWVNIELMPYSEQAGGTRILLCYLRISHELDLSYLTFLAGLDWHSFLFPQLREI